MSIENPNKYIITYSNHFEFNGKLLSFRKRQLFDITDAPKWIKYNETAKCWIVNRKQLFLKTAQNLIINKPIKVDVTSLNWNVQCELDEVFNLE
jgi:hypothetical protein